MLIHRPVPKRLAIVFTLGYDLVSYMLYFGINMIQPMLIVFLCIAAAGAILYYISGIIFPFITAFVLAYLLNPVVSALQRFRLSRTIATSIVIFIFIGAAFAVSTTTIPIMYRQLTKLSVHLGEYASSLDSKIIPEMKHRLQDLRHDSSDRLQSGFDKLSAYAASEITNILKRIAYSGIVAINVLTLVLITPIVTFYILRDWQKIPPAVMKIVPMRLTSSVREIGRELDTVLSGYLKGQIYVCIILACYYTIALKLLGLESAITLGIFSGILTFIPYIGIIFCTSLSVLVSILQFNSLPHTAAVLGVFIIGQIAESNFITPRLIGEEVGLHPVWIMFGIFAFGAMFGLVGVICALPLTAILGVMIKFLLRKYRESRFYNLH